MTHQISIAIDAKFHPMRALWSALIQVGVIGVGATLNSTAMQWTGFLALIILVIAMAMRQGKKDNGLTIAEAHRRLDEIEKETA